VCGPALAPEDTMTPGAASPRRISQPASEGEANNPASASRETPVAIPLDLGPLISSYRTQPGLTLRIEELPPLGRLSAGQNNGDNSWSLGLDELEGLSYFPPQGFDKQHTLKLRLIAKAKRGASPIALIDLYIMGDEEPANAEPAGRKEPLPPEPGFLKKILSLRSALARQDAAMPRGVDQDLTDSDDALAGREAERPQFASINGDLLIRRGEAQTSAGWPQSASITTDLLARKGEAQPWSSPGTQEAEIAAAKQAAAYEAAVKLKAAEARWQDNATRSVAALTARCRAAETALASARAAQHSHSEAELAGLHDQLERLRRHQEVDIAAAKEAAAREAAAKLKAAEAQWQDKAARSVALLTARCRAAEEALASARAAAEAELAALEDQLERLRRHQEVDIAAAKQAAALEAAAKLKAAEVQWQDKAAKSVAELTARCRAAEEATARAAERPEAERTALQDQLERLRRNNEAEIAAAKLEAAEKLKAAEAQWRDQAASSVVELTARCRAAEETLASARAAAQRPEVELAALQDQLERLRRNNEAEIAAAKLDAAEKLKAAEAQWRDQAANSMAELTARCRAAEETVASARAADTDKAETDHAYVRRLNRDITALQSSLVEREADLAQARARLEELRLGIPTPSPASAWHPLSNRPDDSATEQAQDSGHLWRDALIVFFAVMGAVLFWPRVEAALMTAGLLEAPAQPRAVIAAAPTPPPPKPEHPKAIVARAVNMRAEPTTGAAVVSSLKSGMPVAILGHNGNWDQVEISGADGKTLQGWVYGSFLDASGAANP
jgi:hypothetical protein